MPEMPENASEPPHCSASFSSDKGLKRASGRVDLLQPALHDGLRLGQSGLKAAPERKKGVRNCVQRIVIVLQIGAQPGIVYGFEAVGPRTAPRRHWGGQ